MHIRALIPALALSCLLALDGRSQSQQRPPTNSLAFHLQSLGRTPTKEEREVIEAALPLMWKHGCRSDYPLRSIKLDDAKNEWVLFFNSGVVDGAFWLYIHDKNATSFEVHFAGTTWRTKFPEVNKNK
jgi:hypothetical protein